MNNPLAQMSSNLITCPKTGKQYTNDTNLPMEICYLIMHFSSLYDGKLISRYNVSATDLLKPVKAIVLQIQHPYEDDQLTDISTLAKSAKGTMMHEALEQVLTGIPGYTLEKRSDRKVGNWNISGKFDIVHNGEIKDLKTTGNFTLKLLAEDQARMQPGMSMDEMLQTIPNYAKWQIQLSLYRWLNPELVTKPFGKILISLTDGAGFDKQPVDSEHTFPLLPTEQIEQFIAAKLNQVDHYLDNPDQPLPRCSDTETGYRLPEYKLKYRDKNGKYRAYPGGTFNNKSEFDQFCNSKMKLGDVIESTPAKAVLCHYCKARSVCDQFNSIQG